MYIGALLVSPFLRTKALEHYGRMIASVELEEFVNRTYLGDCFLLMTIAKNVDALTFKDILQDLIKKIVESSNTGGGGRPEPMSLFSPHAPSYRHFNIDDEDPIEAKRRMEAELDTRV